MNGQYILEIKKQGDNGADAVNIRLPIDEGMIQRVIAAASNLPVPRVKPTTKVAKSAKNTVAR